MKITVKSLTNEAIKNWDYHEAMAIVIDGKQCFSVHDGELEDANLCRDFNDCWKIPELMERAFNAGKNGEKFEIENLKLDEF